MSTLLLTRADVVRHLEALALLGEMRESFRVECEGRPVAPQRVRSELPVEGSRAVVDLPGVVPGVPAYTVGVRTRHPSREPADRSLLQLRDLATGELLALMEAGHLRAVRAGVVGALAADVLARPDASRVALLGAVPQAGVHLKSLRLVRSLTHVRVYDADPVRAMELATRLYRAVQLPVRPADTVEEAVLDADIVLAMEGGALPEGFPEMLRRGTHVTVLVGEEQGWSELSALRVRGATNVCENRSLLPSEREGGAPPVELGEVLAGRKPGRRSAEEVTVYGAWGLPFQDLVAAWHVYQGARQDDSVQRVEWEA